MKDQMTTCRNCGSKYCYEQIEEGVIATWACLLCGFNTSSKLLVNTTEANAILSALPKLYQQLAQEDSEGFIWVPQYKNVEGVGEVYANTVDAGEDWFWTATKHIPISEKEREKFKNPDGSYRQYKADAANAKHFHKDAFPGALHYLGII